MIDRSKAPLIQSVHQAHLHQPLIHQLDNGIQLYEIKMGEQDVLKLELVFKAGRWYEQEKLIAKATSQLLKAGTASYTAEQLANFFEHFGAKLKIYDGFNRVHIELYCLTKHLPKLLPVLLELVTIPSFEKEELDKFIKRNNQNLKVQLQKNDIIAYRVFTEKLFGQQHPYGYNSTEALYQKVNVSKIKKHFQKQYTANNCSLFIAGKTSPAIIKLINQYLGKIPKGTAQIEPNFPIEVQAPYTPVHQSLIHNSTQASIRIGCRTFDRKNKDWNPFYMMNMVLGGYFGARLMQNLRERNGYTYGVYSSVETLSHSGYWYIHTDVGKAVKEAAVTEIYNEIERLQNELVPKAELDMVRNYTLGMLLTSIDGVFHQASIIKSLVLSDLSPNCFYDFSEGIQNTSSEQIRDMAQKYLHKANLLEVIVE